MTSDAFKRQVEAAKQQAAKTTTVKRDSKVESKKTEMETNTFAQIIFAADKDIKAKKKDLVAALTMDKTLSKEENMKRLEEFTEFKEYLQEIRKEQSLAIIAALDTGVFGNLQNVIEDMNNGIINFNKALEPLMKIIDAVNLLRTKDATNGAFEEIKNYEELETKRKEALKAKEDELAKAVDAVDKLKENLRDLQTNKAYRNWLGNIKKTYQAEILLKQTDDMPKLTAEVTRLTKEVEDLNVPSTDASKFDDPEILKAKAELRQMLTLTSDEHKDQQEKLINIALGFVNTSSDRINDVLTHFGSLEGQLSEVNTNVEKSNKIYGLLASASREAGIANQEIAKSFEPPKLEAGQVEDELEQLERVQKKTAADEYVRSVVQTNLDTAKVSAEIAKDLFTVDQMVKKTATQKANTRQLGSSGVASVSTGLASALTALNGAAINESTKAAEQSMRLMDDKTSAVLMNDAIRDAMGGHEAAIKMQEAAEQLMNLKEGIQSISEITSTGLKEALESKQAVESLVEQVKQQVSDMKAVSTNAQADFNAAAAGNDNTAIPATASVKAPPAKKKALDMNNI